MDCSRARMVPLLLFCSFVGACWAVDDSPVLTNEGENPRVINVQTLLDDDDAFTTAVERPNSTIVLSDNDDASAVLITQTTSTPLLEPVTTIDSDNPYIAALKKRRWESQHGYVNIREDCFMFWWFYYANGTRKKANKKPLIIWIQGGPGFAASGVANFAEIGPLTMDFKPRNHTWVKNYNVLLIDHPVGTGFSFALNDNPDMYAYDDKTIALDLMKTIKGFMRQNPEFRHTPTYIMSQSYGGKIAPRLGYMIHKAVEKAYMKINLKGVGIGSAWVDPGEISKTTPPYLYHLGLIDINTFRNSTKYAYTMAGMISKGCFLEAYELFLDYHKYNELQTILNVAKPNAYKYVQDFEQPMNKYVKPTLHMVRKATDWSYQSDSVFDRLKESFLQPSVNYVEKLLNETTITVAVYNGNLDPTCPMAGAVNWVHNLHWNRSKEFRKAKRSEIPGELNGYYKAVGQLSLWWVLNAGHWVPEDNPEAMQHILHYLTHRTSDSYYVQLPIN